MLTDDRQPKSIGSRQPPAAATRSSAAAGPTCPVHRGAVAEAHLAVVAQPLLVSSTPCGLVNRVLSPVIAGIFRCLQPRTKVVGEEGNDQPSRLASESPRVVRNGSGMQTWASPLGVYSHVEMDLQATW
jgi:hypothetical protein